MLAPLETVTLIDFGDQLIHAPNPAFGQLQTFFTDQLQAYQAFIHSTTTRCCWQAIFNLMKHQSGAFLSLGYAEHSRDTHIPQMFMNTSRTTPKTRLDSCPPSNWEWTRRRNVYTNERRRAPFTDGRWTCESEFYRFPIDECPKDPWEQCFEVVDRADKELYKELKDEISGLLVVASLFLGIVTAFSTMSLSWIRVDDKKVSVALLGDIVKLLNNTDARGTVPPRDATNLNFHPRNSDIIVNQMWFLSMTLSLSAVVVGTLCLQWLSAFRRKELKQRAFIDALAVRQLRFEGLMGWGVPQVPAFLLLIVQGSLVLFAVGLIFMLWSVDDRVAIPVVLVGGTAAVFLTITAIMPVLQSVIGWIFPSTLVIPQCPYKSPMAWILHRGCLLLAIIVTLPLYFLPHPKKTETVRPRTRLWHEKVSDWRLDQIGILKDYTWQTFDYLWRHQRERWGPQQSKSKSKYSYYLVNGLASAIEMLVFQPNAVHIIHTCLQDFHGTSAEEETFEHLFGKDTAAGRQAILEYNAIKALSDERSQPRFSSSLVENLRRDFLNAHALQHLVFHNPKLHHALLPHRVELYTRIRNSSRHLDPLPPQKESNLTKTEKTYVGTSLACPIQCIGDAEALSSELRYQFLKFANWFLDTDMHRESDADKIKHVLDAVKKMQTVSVVNADEPSLEDRFKRVFKLLEKRLTERSHHSRHSSDATATEFGNRENNGTPLGNGRVDQGYTGSKSEGFHDHSDTEVSPSISLSAFMDLHVSVQRKLDRWRQCEKGQPAPCHHRPPV